MEKSLDPDIRELVAALARNAARRDHAAARELHEEKRQGGEGNDEAAQAAAPAADPLE